MAAVPSRYTPRTATSARCPLAGRHAATRTPEPRWVVASAGSTATSTCSTSSRRDDAHSGRGVHRTGLLNPPPRSAIVGIGAKHGKYGRHFERAAEMSAAPSAHRKDFLAQLASAREEPRSQPQRTVRTASASSASPWSSSASVIVSGGSSLTTSPAWPQVSTRRPHSKALLDTLPARPPCSNARP
jgi:hypothetical protein